MSYRNDVDALAARKQALDTEVADRIRERDEAARILEDARSRARLPVLDNIRVASPCSVKWETMTGDERVRTCAQCDKQVFDVSQLTRAEAEALIAEKNGKLCVTYFQRKDGTILLADCEIGRRGVRRRRYVAAGVAAVVAAGGIGALAIHDDEVMKHEEVERIAGGMEAPPYTDPPPKVEPPAAECLEFRDRIFDADDCLSAETRAHLRGVFVDNLNQSMYGDRKQAVDACVNARESLRGMAELCKKPSR